MSLISSDINNLLININNNNERLQKIVNDIELHHNVNVTNIEKNAYKFYK